MNEAHVERVAVEFHRQIRAQRLAEGDEEPEWEALAEPVRVSFREIAADLISRRRARSPQ